MTARNVRREMADLLLIARGHGHDLVTLSSWVLFVKAWHCVATRFAFGSSLTPPSETGPLRKPPKLVGTVSIRKTSNAAGSRYCTSRHDCRRITRNIWR